MLNFFCKPKIALHGVCGQGFQSSGGTTGPAAGIHRWNIPSSQGADFSMESAMQLVGSRAFNAL